MLPKIVLLIVSLVCFSFSAFSQNYKEEFKSLVAQGETTKLSNFLKKWEKARPNDPDLYIAYFNYYINKSIDTAQNFSNGSVSVSRNEAPNRAKENSQNNFDKENFDLAISYIDKGIEKFPNRLDLRFGKTYILGEKKDYQNFTAEILKTVDYSNFNKNQWLWEDDKPLPNPQKTLLNSIQSYIVQLYELGAEYAENVKTIAETILKYYPDSVENLSNLSIYYMINQNFDKALTYLLKAEKLAPQDYIVLNNIAWCYYNKKDKENAIKYYNLVIKYGNEYAKQSATEKIKSLKSNK